MNAAFAALLTTRLTELTKDLRFTYQPTGDLVAPQIIDTMLPRPTGVVEEGQEYPLVRWVICNGEFSRLAPAPFTVMLDGGIYTADSIIDGSRDIAALTIALGRIVRKPWYSPYKLRDRIRFVLGSPEENSLGIQPHPYYFTRLYLEFTVAGNRSTEE